MNAEHKRNRVSYELSINKLHNSFLGFMSRNRSLSFMAHPLPSRLMDQTTRSRTHESNHAPKRQAGFHLKELEEA